MGYGCALLTGVLAALSLGRTALDDLDTVIGDATRAAGTSLTFHQRYAVLNFFPGRGYTMTIDVTELESFQPGIYFTATRLDGKRSGELIVAPGEHGSRALRGAHLESFMKRAEFSTLPLDAVYERYYANPVPMGKAPLVR